MGNVSGLHYWNSEVIMGYTENPVLPKYFLRDYTIMNSKNLDNVSEFVEPKFSVFTMDQSFKNWSHSIIL